MHGKTASNGCWTLTKTVFFVTSIGVIKATELTKILIEVAKKLDNNSFNFSKDFFPDYLFGKLISF